MARARRFVVNWPLRYRVPGDNEWRPAQIVNMSVSGVLFVAQESLPVDQSLELLIRFAQAASGLPGTLVTGRGRVVRVEPSIRGAVAVQFAS